MITANKPDWVNQLEFRRHRLGMSKSAVAKRARVAPATLERILSGRESSPRISNLGAIAAALGVQVNLGATTSVTELQSAHEFRRAQAVKKASRIVGLVQGTMGLESQAVEQGTLNDMLEQTVSELLAGPPRRLWDD
jgi:transcriptional regulator with XRE-family HTH domain